MDSFNYDLLIQNWYMSNISHISVFRRGAERQTHKQKNIATYRLNRRRGRSRKKLVFLFDHEQFVFQIVF